MPRTYSWDIRQLECYPQHEGRSDVVFKVHWRRKALDGDYAAEFGGSQAIALDSSTPFTPFADLTKTQVEGWLKDALGSSTIAQIDAILDGQIRDQVNPPVIHPDLPWA